jgi:hypothetical protein
MPSKNGDRLSNFRALQNVRHAASGETLDRKVKAVDRLHTSLELLLILLLGARRAAKDLSPAPDSQNVGAALQKTLESQDRSRRDIQIQVSLGLRDRQYRPLSDQNHQRPMQIPSVRPTPTFTLIGAGLFGVSFEPLPLMHHALIQPSKIKQGKKPNP